MADAERCLDRELQEALGAAVVARVGGELGDRRCRQLAEDADVTREEREQLVEAGPVNHSSAVPNEHVRALPRGKGRGRA
jgi:hypothetical protein